MRDITAKRLSTLHRVLYRLTGGRFGRRYKQIRMLLLTTTGRRSGNPHTVPLLYLTEDDTIALIASWGGRPYHPEWYLNLLEDPSVEIEIDREHREMRARTADPEERAVWWDRAVANYSGYRGYQAKTDRQIPVVLLESVSSPAGGGATK